MSLTLVPDHQIHFYTLPALDMVEPDQADPEHCHVCGGCAASEAATTVHERHPRPRGAGRILRHQAQYHRALQPPRAALLPEHSTPPTQLHAA